jgi:hypothetical protein
MAGGAATGEMTSDAAAGEMVSDTATGKMASDAAAGEVSRDASYRRDGQRVSCQQHPSPGKAKSDVWEHYDKLSENNGEIRVKRCYCCNKVYVSSN